MTGPGHSCMGMASTSLPSRMLVIQPWQPQRTQMERIAGKPSCNQLYRFLASVTFLTACHQARSHHCRGCSSGNAMARQGCNCWCDLLVVVDCRRADLQERDIVAHLRLSQHLKEKLAVCQAVHGRAFDAAFAQLSPNVAEQLRGALQ